MTVERIIPQSNGYYTEHRPDICRHIPKGSGRVLDVGCAAGNLGAYLKQNGLASEVVGIELIADVANEARTKLDRVYCADLNRKSANEVLGTADAQAFEYIVCADILEHLVEPWQTLSDLTAFLADGGTVIASLPNVRHWSVWLPLILNGKWDYRDAGIMDRTHLRFFTIASMRELFDKAGLEVVSVQPLIGGRWKLLDRLFLHALSGLLAVQWVLLGKRKANTAPN